MGHLIEMQTHSTDVVFVLRFQSLMFPYVWLCPLPVDSHVQMYHAEGKHVPPLKYYIMEHTIHSLQAIAFHHPRYSTT